MIDFKWRALCAVSALLLISGCGAGTKSSPGAVGEPEFGGSITLMTNKDPRILDPGVMSNQGPQDGALGNALYGQLVASDATTGEITPELAESLTSQDGSTWTLTLRDGLVFSDGSPFGADAVAFGWDRMKDPTLGALDGGHAAGIVSTTVLSPTTLRIDLVAPTMQFGRTVAATALNWIASPAALRAGPRAFDNAPIGAGPFVLQRWVRGGALDLVKNPNYFDAPKPYLDTLRIVPTADQNQRFASLQSGAAQVIFEPTRLNEQRARDAGMTPIVVEHSGGIIYALNNARGPFSDVRARKAVSAAIDLEQFNLIRSGVPDDPDTLFVDSSPFYDPDKKIHVHDPVLAQKLLDELAAEGKPLSFSITAYSTPESQRGSQALQAQLLRFDNIEVTVESMDFAGLAARLNSGDYDMSITGMNGTDPEPMFYQRLFSQSRGNPFKVVDPQLDEALAQGRMSTDVDERRRAYGTVQDRLIELTPFILYTRPGSALLSAPTVGGVSFTGLDSPSVAGLWVVAGD
ncbi:ABC transporter substrate-binding protein [Nocardia jinanensis]|uniref:Diguanylate cyclase n=1 Tax=Nocardia jinanensis TaxID=382504 RepID=A0A917VT89_9NOCA|nr:ABC transporter substrate-binding protein [Nocardia jinanensis]GGL12310.1 diguanylate cyclase [Nocardia jinanensis]